MSRSHTARLLVAGCLAIWLAAPAAAADIQTFDLDGDRKLLSFRLAKGDPIKAPLTHAEQSGFSNAQISPNRKLIGWTVDFANCCTSYPLPRALVVHDGQRVVLNVPADLSIFKWRFSKDSASIVFQREYPHGNDPISFHWVRIRDGVELGEFTCYPLGNPDFSGKPIKPPRWTGASDRKCVAS